MPLETANDREQHALSAVRCAPLLETPADPVAIVVTG